MMRVHTPQKNCCRSRQPDSGRFAPRGFANRAEDKEIAGEHKPLPLDFDMTGLPLYPPVQAKLAGGSAGDGPENEDAASSKGTGEKAPAFRQVQPEAHRQEPNRTGMPDRLKAGIETLSGIDMSDVRVHANSALPAQLNALAYTQGNQIYMGPGQERHLPHEAWHVVQQAQGRVRATRPLKGLRLNDHAGLEAEASTMSARAAELPSISESRIGSSSLEIVSLPGFAADFLSSLVFQRMEDKDKAIEGLLKQIYGKLYEHFAGKSSFNWSKPSQLEKDGVFADIVGRAENEDGAINSLIAGILKSGHVESTVIFDTYKKYALSCRDRITKDQLQKEMDLQEAQRLEQDSRSKPGLRRQKPDRKEVHLDLSQAQKEELPNKIRKLMPKLVAASPIAYTQHCAKARPTVKERSGTNTLAEKCFGPLSSTDFSKAFSCYKSELTGKSLNLGGGVTMSRKGGMQIQQLGTYLPPTTRGPKSVQETMDQILKQSGITSRQLAIAINMRDSNAIAKRFPSLTSEQIQKIQAMRALMMVEIHRAPELLLGTLAEHRRSAHGFSHVKDYPTLTPMAPPGAAAELTKSRKDKGKQSLDASNIPEKTLERALASITGLLTSAAKKPPANDPALNRLLQAVVDEPEDGEPSDNLVDAITECVSTPAYAIPEDEEMAAATDSTAPAADPVSKNTTTVAAASSTLLPDVGTIASDTESSPNLASMAHKKEIGKSKEKTLESLTEEYGGALSYGSSVGNNCLIYAIAGAIDFKLTDDDARTIRSKLAEQDLVGVDKFDFLPGYERVIDRIVQLLSSLANEKGQQFVDACTITLDTTTHDIDPVVVNISGGGKNFYIIHHGNHYYFLK